MKRLIRMIIHRIRRNQRARRLRFLEIVLKNRLDILVVADSGIGNTIMATPLVQAVKILWPAAQVDLLTSHTALFSRWPIVRQLYGDPANIDPMRYDHFFLCYDTRYSPEQWKPGAQQHRVESPRGGGPFTFSEADYNLTLLRQLGYRGGRPSLYAEWTQPDPSPWNRPGDRIVLAPGGLRDDQWLGKHWHRWSELIPILLQPGGRLVLVLGGSTDRGLDVPRIPGVINAIDQYSLDETAGIIRSSNLVIANDCGLAHLADALQIPHIVLFGPTDELKNGPLHTGVVITPPGRHNPSQIWHASASGSDTSTIDDISPTRVAYEADRLLTFRKSRTEWDQDSH